MDDNHFAPLPHHTLQAYHVALEFLRLVHETRIVDADNRKHARGAARSCARNLAEGSGGTFRGEKRRKYNIAHGELCESVASVEMDNAMGGCPTEQLDAVLRLGSRLNAMIQGLIR